MGAPSKYSQYYSKWVELYSAGMSTVKIASIYSCSDSSVGSCIHKYGTMRTPTESAILLDTLNPKMHLFDDIDSEESAYYLGLIYSDGCLARGRGSYIVTIALNATDEDILVKFADIVGRDLNRYSRRSPDSNKISHMSTVRVCSFHMYHQLDSKGVHPRKSYIDSDSVFNYVPNELMHHFIRGLIDGDGHIMRTQKGGLRRGWQIGLASGTTSILTRTSKVIHNNVGTPMNKLSDHEVRWAAKKDVYNILTWLYKDATIYMQRKYNKYHEFMEEYDA